MAKEQSEAPRKLWSARASERRAEGRACRGFERLAATALLAVGETRLARIQGLRSQRGEAEAYEADCASYSRLVLGLGRWFTGGAETPPFGEISRTRRAALHLGVEGLLEMPTVQVHVREETTSVP
ncbi:MAG: hypothetical protein NT059_01175 [Planctomycetota bacterium]|nr:hypothetical protein [Planctomycetota bacterium]